MKKIRIPEHLHFSIAFTISDSDCHSQPTKYRQLSLSSRKFISRDYRPVSQTLSSARIYHSGPKTPISVSQIFLAKKFGVTSGTAG